MSASLPICSLRPTSRRRYHLSASHRLHSDAFTADQNRAIYGKCNNPHGHGHNYIIEVTVAGPVDRATGMVCDLGELDAFAQTNLLDRFDHMNLNTLDSSTTSFRPRKTLR